MLSLIIKVFKMFENSNQEMNALAWHANQVIFALHQPSFIILLIEAAEIYLM